MAILKRPIAIRILIFFVFSVNVHGFYLPGVAPQDFQMGDALMVKVNKLTSTKTQLPYSYYSLPYCRPEKIVDSAENLGEVLRGDRIENSPFVFKMRESQMCAAVCRVKLDKKSAKALKEKIVDEYRVNMILDNLPLVVPVQRPDQDNVVVYQHGFHVGLKGIFVGKKEEKYFIHNHLTFTVRFHRDIETDSSRIVGFEVKPFSIKHEYEGEWNEKTRLTTCDPHTKRAVTNSESPQEVEEGSEIIFTYDVDFQESEVKWASRWDTYLLMADDQIHWFSIVNSMMIVLFLSGMVAMIMLRTLYRDISNYNQLETHEEVLEETGWKLVHGDVFRPPENPELLCVYAGTGVQCFGMILVTMIFACLGFLSPSNRGGLMTAMLLLWVFMGLLAGYASSRLYKTLRGTEWKKIALRTAFMFPATVFVAFFVLNAIIWGQKSSGAVPFGTMFALVVLWFGISVPLVFIGSYIGFRKPALEDPVKTNKIPRQVPIQAWYMNPIFSILIGGILPFGAVFIELFFILTSIWLHQFYYIFGFLFIVFIILIITCAEITVVLCYFQLCSEDYQWWWRSYLTSGSSAVYLFLYAAFYFYTKLEITKLVSAILYFGYMLVVSYVFFVFTGAIGFYACFWFTRLIYSSSHLRRLIFPRTLTLPHAKTQSSWTGRRVVAMDSSGTDSAKEVHVGLDSATEEEYATQSKLLQEFMTIPTIDKAWILSSVSGSQAMVAMSQANLLANKRRKFMLSALISKDEPTSYQSSVNFHWAPFPIEMTGASAFVPSPSGLKLLVIRNPENESPTKFEIWSSSQLDKEFHIPQKVHGSVYLDGWFEGISWNSDETRVAYVAEEPSPPKPTFDHLGFYKKETSSDKDIGSWKGQGDWEDEWGEAYAGKKQPALFVIDVDSGEVEHIKGVPRSISVGQVVWSPNSKGSAQYLVFAGWLGDKRKLGLKHCYNRPCAIYAVRCPEPKDDANEALPIHNLTKSISSGFCPRFSKDGKFLLFLSAKAAVDSGAHCSTESLHKISWPSDGKLPESTNIVDVIEVVNCPDDGCFPGLYVTGLLSDPWLSDGHTLILSSYWRSCRVILSLNVISGELSRVSPNDSDFSWSVLALDGDNVVAVSSSPVSVPEIKYGKKVLDPSGKPSWHWSSIQKPIFKCSEKVTSGLSSLQFKILNVPVSNVSECLTEGAKRPFEAIYVSSSETKENGKCDPLVVVLHGGPHTVSPCSFSKQLAYLSSIGYSLLIVNYRGSLGFGEDALQSVPGKIGSQDVNDVLSAVDHAVEMGLADPSRITVLGGSHGGFLTTHLIGQAPDKFVAAAARNPVCNIASMVGITDIPDWCFFEAYGDQTHYTEAPSPEDMSLFHQISPISHISKVKTPTLFLLGTVDLRVPISNGFQYVRALKEKGADVKVLVFPNDNHSLDRPQTDYESFLNIAVWFNKYSKL